VSLALDGQIRLEDLRLSLGRRKSGAQWAIYMHIDCSVFRSQLLCGHYSCSAFVRYSPRPCWLIQIGMEEWKTMKSHCSEQIP
jgi:hypothetical protein